jgi:hypothetical protein
MIQLYIILVFFIILIALSAYPIIELKYESDLYDYIDTINKFCYQNNEERLNKLPEKDKYIWKISNHLLDYNDISNKKIYNMYILFSWPLFVFLILFCALYIFTSMEYIRIEYYKFTLLSYVILYVIAYIIIFSIILKKITEIYNDTKVKDYVENIKKKNKDINTDDNIVIDYDFLNKNKINLEHYYSFHSREEKENIKSKINIVVNFLFAYLLFALPLILMILKTIDNYFIYIYIIIILFISILSHYIYNVLQ